MTKSELDSWRNNLETAKELFLDEQKLITYISLAKDLCLHVNDAKKILTEVLEDVRKKQPTMHINVNHIISGLSSNNSAKTIICSEPELETYKNSFNTVFYHHIYSIGLGKEGVDSAALVSLSGFKDFSLCPGLIKSTVCSKRTSEDTETLKLKCQVQNTVTETKLPLKKEKTVEKVTNTDNKPVKVKTEVISPKKETSNGSVNKTNSIKTKGISGFFTKSNSTSSKSNKIENSQTSKSDNKGLSSFLTKSNSAPITKPNETVKYKTENSNKTVKVEKMEIDVETTEETSKKSIKTEPETSKIKSKSLSQIKKNGKINKKRKRVLQVSDSDSDNDPFSDEKPQDPESEDEIPPTPATNTVKITSGILNPKKRRKIVDKTYTDEEGYILTRKEEIYESCSDDEVVPEPTVQTVKVEKENVQEPNKLKTEDSPKDKKVNKVSKKKISPPQKGKQATMMSFFKKI